MISRHADLIERNSAGVCSSVDGCVAAISVFSYDETRTSECAETAELSACDRQKYAPVVKTIEFAENESSVEVRLSKSRSRLLQSARSNFEGTALGCVNE